MHPVLRACGWKRCLERSAGACPPRSLFTSKTVRDPESPDVFCSVRSMARDRPSPYGPRRFSAICHESRRCHRSAGACPPRLLSHRKPSAVPGLRPFSVMSEAWRGTGPRPTVRGSDLGVARDRPSPYVEAETGQRAMLSCRNCPF